MKSVGLYMRFLPERYLATPQRAVEFALLSEDNKIIVMDYGTAGLETLDDETIFGATVASGCIAKLFDTLTKLRNEKAKILAQEMTGMLQEDVKVELLPDMAQLDFTAKSICQKPGESDFSGRESSHDQS